MIELKPCPFCGGKGYVSDHIFKGLVTTYGIRCEDCGSETRQFYYSEKEAADAWNRRRKE